MEKPYVISAELELRNPRVTPLIKTGSLDAVRESLNTDLRAMGKNATWVNAADIQQGVRGLVRESKLPVLSLDDRYLQMADARLGISRGISESLQDAGYAPRAGYVELEKQFNAASKLGSEVQLVDDVVFSGDMLLWVAEQLKQRDIRVGRVVCGIAIGEGVEKLEAAGIPIDSVVSFDEVEDEICERDFFIVPGSGRRIASTKQNALYFDTANGKPEQWASLPQNATQDFFLASLERSRQLIRPGTQIEQIGNFKGFAPQGDALSTIETRIQEEM